MIKITALNPYEDLARLDELSKRVPELALLRGGGVLIEYGDDKETPPIVVRSQDLFELPSLRQLRGGDRFDSAFTGEDAITSALQRFRQGKGVKVAFTTGHGEPKPDDPGGKGLGNWRARLARVGCEVTELRLDQGDIPDDLALLIVVGPVDPFKPEEVARIRAYAERGKPLLLLLGNEHPTGLEDLLKAHNLEIGKGIVIDSRSNYNGNWELVVAPSRSRADHPIVGGDGHADRGGAAAAGGGRSSDRRPVAAAPGCAGVRPGGQEPRPHADPQDRPVLLGRVRPEEPAADARSLDRRGRPGDRRRGDLEAPGAAPARRPGGGTTTAGAVLLPDDGRERPAGDHPGEPRPADECGELAPRPPRHPGPLAQHAYRLDPHRRSPAPVAADPGPDGHGRDDDHRHGDHRLRRAARMMKANRTTIVLIVLFFGGLIAVWGLDLSGVPRQIDIERRADRVLPELIDTPEAEVRRVEIDREKDHLVFERRGEGLGRWQMLAPKDVAAEPVRLDALVRNLKELRKDSDAGTIKGDPEKYGLAPPAATVRLYAERRRVRRPPSHLPPRWSSARRCGPAIRPSGRRCGHRCRRRPAAQCRRPARDRLAASQHDGRCQHSRSRP